MGSFDSEDGRKARNSMPAKLNGRGGSETELSASRASTPKSARSERTSKIPVKNGLSKPNSRASTPKSTQGDRPKSAARNGASKPGSRQSTPKPQSRAQPPAELPFSGFKSSPKEPLLMPRSSSKGSTAGARPKNVSTPKAQTASEVLPSEDALSETPSAVDSNPSKDPKPQSSKENSSTGRPRKPASRSRGVSKVQSTPQNPSVSKPKSTKSLRVQELANDASEPTTPTSEPDLTHSANSTPSEKTNRTRRRADKQASKPINLVAEIPGYSSAEDIATPVQDTPLSGVEDSAEPNKRPLRGTRSTRRGAKVSASAVEDKPLDSPAVSEPQDIEMADAPIPNSEGVSFGDDSEMGGLNGIDSNAEAPVSPTSSSARASGRVRKPTTKAIESAASSAKRARRNGMAQPAAPKTAKRTRTRKGRAPRKKAPSAQAKRMFDIASAAVCSGYVPREDAATILADLRREFEQKAKEREAQARAKSVAGDDKNESE